MLAQERRLGLARRAPGRSGSDSRDRPCVNSRRSASSPVRVTALAADRANSARHLRRRLQVALGIGAAGAGRPAASVVCSRMQVSTSNSGRSAGVAKRTPLVARTRHAERLGQRHQRLVVVLPRRAAGAAAVPRRRGRGRRCRRADRAARRRRAAPTASNDRPASATSPLACPSSSSSAERALAFRRAQLHARDQPAEVAVALLGGDEKRQMPAVGGRQREAGRAGAAAGGQRRAVRARPRRHFRARILDGELGADEGTQAGGFGRLMEARGAVKAVAVEQRDRGVTEQRRALDERLGQGGRPEEAEGGRGVEFYVHGGGSGARGLGSRARGYESGAELQTTCARPSGGSSTRAA